MKRPWWERPIRGFFRGFNRGFERLGGAAIGWLVGTRRALRRSSCSSLYAGILAFGLNEFRKTPIGFIPQVDRGYLIAVAPAAAGRFAGAHRRGQSQRVGRSALKIPGVAHAVNFVGFSGATFTNAPNSGAIFVVARAVRRAREGSHASPPPRITGRAVQAACRDPGGLDLRRPAAAGARHRQCRRLPDDGRGSRRPRPAGACRRRSTP